jgi:hypothetical protein
MAIFPILGFVLAVVPLWASRQPADIKYGYPYPPRGPLGGWNILNSRFVAESHEDLDADSFEWDYFMIHDKNSKFSGIVGMVLVDPRGKARGIMPSGGNIAVLGKLNGRIISNFENFGLGVNASAEEAYMHCPKGDGEHPTSWGIESVASTDPPTIRLQGEMEDVIYDFEVRQDWTEREGLDRKKGPRDVVAEGPFAPMTAPDVGFNPRANWTVNMFWPRTKVVGTITDKRSNESFAIDAHGYRENSFGRWFFALGGWDFAIMSDAKSGVQWNWQSYYTVKTLIPTAPQVDQSRQGSTLDVSFIEPETKRLRAVQFSGEELGWEHPSWSFRPTTRQCMPSDLVVTAANDELEVVMKVHIGNDQAAMLSDATLLVKAYVIEEWFPYFNGTIRRTNDSEPFVSFQGVGGGEISMLRNLLPDLPTWACEPYGKWFQRGLGTANSTFLIV